MATDDSLRIGMDLPRLSEGKEIEIDTRSDDLTMMVQAGAALQTLADDSTSPALIAEQLDSQLLCQGYGLYHAINVIKTLLPLAGSAIERTKAKIMRQRPVSWAMMEEGSKAGRNAARDELQGTVEAQRNFQYGPEPIYPTVPELQEFASLDTRPVFEWSRKVEGANAAIFEF
ncbi:MAG: hypothetical protein Q9225_007352 [Loekoesia sp. 1 TL-2023]